MLNLVTVSSLKRKKQVTGREGGGAVAHKALTLRRLQYNCMRILRPVAIDKY